MKTIISCLIVALLVVSGCGQKSAPIIDVHLHASPANSQGPPPLAMCTLMNPFPTRDSRPLGEMFMRTIRKST